MSNDVKNVLHRESETNMKIKRNISKNRQRPNSVHLKFNEISPRCITWCLCIICFSFSRFIDFCSTIISFNFLRQKRRGEVHRLATMCVSSHGKLKIKNGKIVLTHRCRAAANHQAATRERIWRSHRDPWWNCEALHGLPYWSSSDRRVSAAFRLWREITYNSLKGIQRRRKVISKSSDLFNVKNARYDGIKSAFQLENHNWFNGVVVEI